MREINRVKQKCGINAALIKMLSFYIWIIKFGGLVFRGSFRRHIVHFNGLGMLFAKGNLLPRGAFAIRHAATRATSCAAQSERRS